MWSGSRVAGGARSASGDGPSSPAGRWSDQLWRPSLPLEDLNYAMLQNVGKWNDTLGVSVASTGTANHYVPF